MRPGQVVRSWWQQYVAGRLLTPRDIRTAALVEDPDPASPFERFLDDPVDGPTWDVPKRLSAPHFILSDGHMRQWDRADWQYADQRLMRWSAVLIELARKRGIPLYVHCCFRSEEEQRKVNSGGHSKAAYPRSPHNTAQAVDIVHGVYHWALTRDEWRFIHLLGLRALDLVNRDLKKADKLDLTWGGDFKSLWDPAHWEVTDYRARIERLAVGVPIRRTPRWILRHITLAR